MNNNEAEVKQGLFAIGDKNETYQKYFIGQSYLQSLVADPEIEVGVSNVSFEPGCRNNWHKHNNGFQILIGLAGEGWFQEEGKPAKKMHPGDVVVIHDGAKHWHGATKNSWFSHLAITAGTPEWLEPVSEEYYQNLEK